MNKERRQELNDVLDHLDDAIGRLEEIISDEQDAFDDLNEGLQNSKTGDGMLAAIDQMTEISNDIEAVKVKIDKIINPKKTKNPNKG